MLRQPQIEGLHFLYGAFHGRHLPGCRGAVLCHGMGVGKTLTLLALVHTLQASGQARSALALLPSAVLAQWGGEISKFFRPAGRPAVTPPLVYVAIDDGAQRAFVQAQLDRLRGGAPIFVAMTYGMAQRHLPRFVGRGGRVDVLIADEAHALRSHGAARYNAVRALPARALVLATATPVHNSLDELRALLELCGPVRARPSVRPPRFPAPAPCAVPVPPMDGSTLPLISRRPRRVRGRLVATLSSATSSSRRSSAGATTRRPTRNGCVARRRPRSSSGTSFERWCTRASPSGARGSRRGCSPWP